MWCFTGDLSLASQDTWVVTVTVAAEMCPFTGVTIIITGLPHAKVVVRVTSTLGCSGLGNASVVIHTGVTANGATMNAACGAEEIVQNTVVVGGEIACTR
jgi:hypothetical protein